MESGLNHSGPPKATLSRAPPSPAVWSERAGDEARILQIYFRKCTEKPLLERINSIGLYEKYIAQERRELMATRWRALHKKAKRRQIKRSEECEGCGFYVAIECRLSPGDDEPDYRYCADCADKNGFCICCGIFSAGVDSFDFGRYPGYCDNCQDELRADDERWEEEAFEEEFDFELY
jgi:hypothetical protein